MRYETTWLTAPNLMDGWVLDRHSTHSVTSLSPAFARPLRTNSPTHPSRSPVGGHDLEVEEQLVAAEGRGHGDGRNVEAVKQGEGLGGVEGDVQVLRVVPGAAVRGLEGSDQEGGSEGEAAIIIR